MSYIKNQSVQDIFVPPLVEGDKVVVPAVWLGEVEQYRKHSNGSWLSAAEYQKFYPPTLAQLRHAYFDKDPDENFISPRCRENILRNRGVGEWTSTFLRGGREVIDRPKMVYDEYHNLWIAEGGTVTPVELPPSGWTLEYNKSTGFPSRTSRKREDAEKIFGCDASKFDFVYNKQMSAVLRFYTTDGGPFMVSVYCEPGDISVYVGARVSVRPYPEII